MFAAKKVSKSLTFQVVLEGPRLSVPYRQVDSPQVCADADAMGHAQEAAGGAVRGQGHGADGLR